MQWGQVVLEIICANCADLLNRLQKNGIHANNVIYKSDIVIQITVSAWDLHRIEYLVEKCSGTVSVHRISGVHTYLLNAKKHIIIYAVVLILFLVTLLVPRKILFISVDGNTSIPENRIIEAAETCGLHFGADRRSVRSEVIKNALLQEIPQLQWAGVNTIGCTATISVREKTETELREDTENQVCSIVAVRDGIIRDCTVYQGNQLCKTGQAVKAGQILVSGYTDCGTLIKATQAKAEITALTFRNLSVISTNPIVVRGVEKSRTKHYSIRFGKKLINLSKDSGNLDAICAKIYVEKSVCLPGGFALPIAVICETVITYDKTEEFTTVTKADLWIENYSTTYLKSSMIAGEIISAQTEMFYGEDVCVLYGSYACIEMIGQARNEQMLLKG